MTLGATLFTIAGAFGPVFDDSSTAIRFDPTRVAAQVVTGIGFLGAGAILRQGINIRGLTTAASIWVSAAIGVAVGLGYWEAATTTTFIALLSLLLLKPVEHFLVHRPRSGIRKLIVDIGPKTAVGEVVHILEEKGVGVRSMKILEGGEGQHQISAMVYLETNEETDALLARLVEAEGVLDVDVSR